MGIALMRGKSGYLLPGRLADVLALIQVLAMDQHAHRSEGGLAGELQGPPRSASSWPKLAEMHPEFFRVRPEGKNRISLVARHAQPRQENGRPPLLAEYTSKLMQLAVELHDREVRRSQSWHIWLPILALLLGALLTWLGAYIKPASQVESPTPNSSFKSKSLPGSA